MRPVPHPPRKRDEGRPLARHLSGQTYRLGYLPESLSTATEGLSRPRKAVPALLQFVANDVDWLSTIDHD